MNRIARFYFFFQLAWTIAFLFGASAFAEEAKPIKPLQWEQVQSLRAIPSRAAMRRSNAYIFFDPNCPWCARLYEQMRDAEWAKSVDTAWVPVAYMRKDSLGKAAAIMRSGSFETVRKNFDGFHYQDHHGNAIEVNPSEQEVLSFGKAKTVWLELGGITPLIVYKNKSDQILMMQGLPTPDKLKAVLNSVAPTGLTTFKP